MPTFLKINNLTIKQPTEINHSYQVLDKKERTMDGTMVVDIIGQKRRLEVKWEHLSKEDMQVLATHIQSGDFVTVHFNAPDTGVLTSMVARPENFSYEPYYDWVRSKVVWKGINITFLEK